MSFDSRNYEVKVPYPKRLPKPYQHDFSKDSKGAYAYAKALKEYEESLPAYKEAQRQYNIAEREMHEKFKKDALENCGLADHPNADKIFSYCWRESHSEGEYSVWNKLEEISDLFIIDPKAVAK